MVIDKEMRLWFKQYYKRPCEIRKQNDSGIILGVCMALGILLLVMISTCNPAHADKIIIKGDSKNPCGCNRESKDNVCIAYYQLKDEGFDVKVTCPKSEG